jgi:chromosome segregation protein
VSTARLRSLRLVGFKSFAERTVVEFGPGISAIVGPNGSGKSNLADALRWVLGEQGRTLRTRRAEDLIYAGSSSRRAQGMSDVTLLLDNEDGLLPVGYAEVELGRRLFRNGENEFLLNRQRVRLRDLVDLLDEANLADNAFLFIGQGMVDQALALRPEERRPLFEEAAGIRRHERRRRAAEAELAQAEANLERVRDVVDELRPQARRLAAQAEQQRERRSAGAELAEALVAAARARLGGAARELAQGTRVLDRARADADAAMERLRGAESASSAAARALASRQEAERAERDQLETARARVVELRLADSRAATDADALGRDLARSTRERETLHQRMAAARLELAVALPEPDATAEAALGEVSARLVDAERQLVELRDLGRVAAERTQQAREARAAGEAALARARTRAATTARAVETQAAQVAVTGARAAEAVGEADRVTAEATRLAAAEADAEDAAATAREALAAAEERLAGLVGVVTRARSEADAARAHLDALTRRLQAGDAAALADALRDTAGRRLDEGLEVEPKLRTAVAAVLGDALTATSIPATVAERLSSAAASGTVVVEARTRSTGRAVDTSDVMARMTGAGGGPLTAAVLRDPTGHVTRLLARSAWVPDLATALRLMERLPAGWRLATLDGALATDEGVVRLGTTQDALEVRARAAEAEQVMRDAAGRAEAAERGRSEAAAARQAAADALEAARTRLEDARRERRVSDDRARSAVRAADAAAREAAWANTQSERLTREAATAEAELRTREAEAAVWQGTTDDAPSHDQDRAQAGALAARVAALHEERERHASAADAGRRRRDEAVEARRRAEVRLAIDETRLAELDAEAQRLVAGQAERADEVARIRERLAEALASEGRAAASLAATEAAGGDERARRQAAEEAASAAREEVRAAEARARAAEVAAMSAQLQLDSGREALLVELAGIGADGLRALTGTDVEPDPDGLGAELERALDATLARWSEQPLDAAAPAISSGRLASLRRRYHELGAGNPFAAEELAEVRERLDGLESQQADLASAIRDTRALITRLEALIADQFRQTFTALEGAFSRRFEQLFGGGDASLALTTPEDLGQTGVEITARPPGKKRQPLAMLSGGERALTAVALLLAMLEVRPVPFCVLDEVDAALDEANVGRFAAALRSLAERTQFVVITHNRGTIETADALYGVTAGDDAVSRVVSLRLSDLPPVDGEPARGDFAGAIR